eukprot:m.111140 g.111140  ORF g.111140 m.111140 type:complete len:351 (+) comp12761_c10_seq8:549-1601(+)
MIDRFRHTHEKIIPFNMCEHLQTHIKTYKHTNIQTRVRRTAMAKFHRLFTDTLSNAVKGNDRQGVRFCVEHPLVQVYLVCFVKEKIQILEGFTKKETLHLIPELWRIVENTHKRRIPSRRNSAVLLKVLVDAPAPVLVFLVPCDPVHDEEALHSLGAKEIMCIRRFYVNGVVVWTHVKVNNLRRKTRWLTRVHLIACVHQLLCNLEVLVWKAVKGAEGKRPGHEAHEVIHLWTRGVVEKFTNVQKILFLCSSQQVLLHSINRLQVHVLVEVVLLPRQEPLLQQVLVVAVATGTERDCAPTEPSSVGVDEDGNKTVLLWETVKVLHNLCHTLRVVFVACDIREVFELELYR